ncbi:MAG: SDR family NAD(P)-dependent oxidoreductase, partial [Chloroflexi bacterium]|nr:SDR family NAD(P)-dependent oxidoreductase [Chloroflexota bacterium]
VGIDWAALHGDAPRRKVALPTYPFQRQRYWVNTLTPALPHSRGGSLRPLIDRVTHLPQRQETLFESEFSLQSLPFLADHRVFETVISPGACQLAMALSGAQLLLASGQPVQLEDILLPQPLVIPGEEARTVQALFGPADSASSATANGRGPQTGASSRHAFQVISFPAGPLQSVRAATPATHATGYASPLSGQPAVVDLAALRQRCPQPVDLAGFYAGTAQAHIALGPAFRWLAEAWQSEEISADPSGAPSILARIRLPEASGGMTGYLLHPGLLDACFQAAGLEGMGQETRLPFAAERIRLYAPVTGEEWWCHTRQAQNGTWTIALLDGQGSPLLAIDGFETRAVKADAIQGAHLRADWLYTLRWEAAPADENGPVFSPACWLLLGGDDPLTDGLAARLAGQGAAVVTAQAGDVYAFAGDQTGGAAATVTPGNPAHFQRLLADVAARYPSVGVAYLWGARAGAEDDDIPGQTLRLSSGLLHLAQALADAPFPPSPAGEGSGVRVVRLWLVTRGAAFVGRTDSPPYAAASALWGLGRVLAQEMPALNCAAIDLDGNDPAVQAERLLGELTRTAAPASAPLAGQIAWRGGQRYAARLVRWSPPAQGKERTLRADGSYLITGGLGGLGLETAQQLIDDGARHLVMSGRSGATSEAARTALARWREQRVDVQVVQADIARREDAERLIAACDARAPLTGIVHAAGVLDDGALAQQSAARFAAVMQPKVAGTWHLHRLTAQRELDFFVCFSSAASLLGSPGQSNYAAANAFVDGLMAQRQVAGLPGCAVQWGPWAEVGLAAQLTERMQAQGMGMIHPAQGRAILGALLADGPAQVGVIPARLSPLGEIVTQAVSLRRSVADPAKPRLGEALQAASPAERPRLLEEYLRQEIAQVLRLPVAVQIGLEDHLFQLGFDSLMAVELKNRLQNALGVPLRSTLLFDHPTLAGLIGHLAGENGQGAAEASMPPLVKVERSGPIPLSFAQQRLWFNQTSNRAASYNILAPFRLAGRLDVAALERSLIAVQERHEVLRTTFPTVDGEAVQVIGEARPVQLSPVHLPGLAEAERAAACERLIRQEVEHLYDLAQGPLWRVVLAQFDEADYFLLLAFHHILLDAGSLGQLLEELSQLYNGYRRGAAVQLSPLAFDYADYAHWQRRTLTPEVIESRVQGWAARLSGDGPLFALRSDRPRPAQESLRGGMVPLRISVGQVERLRALQSVTGATLFHTVLAAWTALLYRWGEGDELVVGSPFANRPHRELDGVVGHWGSMLLLPLGFRAEMTFEELAQQVGQATQAAIAADVPFDRLVQALPPARKRINLPHQVFFSFAPGRSNRLRLDGLTATALEKKSNLIRPDVALTVWEEEEAEGVALAGMWEYKLDLFEEETIRGMMADFHRLLDTVTAEPTSRIGDVSLACQQMEEEGIHAYS